MKSYLSVALKKGLSAAKKNAVAGIFLQIIAVTLIILYYKNAAVKQFLDQVGVWNVQWSPWFGVIMTTLFGGVIPLLIEAFQARRTGRNQKTLLQIITTLLLWASNGFIVVKFYEFQAGLFGDAQDFLTVLKKVLVDQFIYVPLYIIPVFTLFFLWRDVHFSGRRLREELREKSFLDRALPLMISNWSVWIPAVCVIYAFPLSLQLVLMNLILVFWSLILTIFISGEE